MNIETTESRSIVGIVAGHNELISATAALVCDVWRCDAMASLNEKETDTCSLRVRSSLGTTGWEGSRRESNFWETNHTSPTNAVLHGCDEE